MAFGKQKAEGDDKVGTVVGVNIPVSELSGKKFVETGYAASGQATKTGEQSNSEETGTRFLKCLTNGFSRLEKAQEAKTGTESPDEDDGSSDTTVISGLLTQLFIVQQPVNTNGTEENLPEGQTAIAVSLLAGERGAVAAAAEHSAGKENGIITGFLGMEDSPEPIGGPQNDEGLESAGLLSQATGSAEFVSSSSNEIIQKAVVSGEQNARGRQTSQTKEEDTDQKSSVISKGNVTENIIRAMKNESGEGKTGQPNEELLKDKEKPVSIYSAKENKTIGVLLTAGGSTEDMENIQKSQAVEKAINRFLNDFRGAETGKSEIQIVLEPESLGSLTISVSRTENGISAKIKSEDREMCAMISSQIEKLVHSMESKGVTVENVDVVFGGTEQNLSFANSFGGRQEQSAGYTAHSGGKMAAIESAGFFDQWQVPGSVGNETSATFEYRI
ncbi:hypothetical protein SDC9_49958 [bioreactor metagenome]|uniref:Flagellar hook-length control protein-like C-terminal domain-containing protein n=1 Tax=bioreactor metagenome TaxID=1076179 RepID=A0A644WJI2_9ZZZZ